MSGPGNSAGTVLCISSHVAGGPVGNSAVVPAIERLGLTALNVPTTVLSNHPGHGAPEGQHTAAATLAAMLSRLRDLGWLDGCAGVLTGYFTEADQVHAAADAIRQMKADNPALIYLCDPVIGDDHTGLYVAGDIAAAICDELVALADVVAPNRFELAWLSGRQVDGREAARFAARALPVPAVLASSLPSDAGRIATAFINRDDVTSVTTAWRDSVPHGTGDLLSGLFLAGLIRKGDGAGALCLAMAQLEAVLDASGDTDKLDLVRGLDGAHDVRAMMPDGGTMVAGVDGCPAGWLAVLWNGDPGMVPEVRLCRDFAEVLGLPAGVIAVDIPIGLPERTGHGGRQACVEARARLGERRSSVFSVPSRAAVMCSDYGEACRVNLVNSDPPRKVSKQCFMLFGKMREADALMTPELQSRIYEAHPELAFWAMNGQRPLDLPKKVKSVPAAPGLALRRGLLAQVGFPVEALERPPLTRSKVGDDDLIDAAALAWTALRIARGGHITVPERPPRDGRGLRMEINA